MKTIVGLFDTFDEAKKAAGDLQSAGVPQDDISLVANNESGQYAANSTDTTTDTTTHTGHAIGHDAKVGAEIGAVAGLAIGLTGLAIPGLGWIAAAGWFWGTIAGAATGAVLGGLTGALTHVGVPEEDATYYSEGVRRGGTLLAVRATDEQAHRVAEILGDDGAINIDERAEQYRREGFVPGAATAATSTATLPSTATTAANLNTTGNANINRNTNSVNAQGETVLPVIEENLSVGKREVQSGGVRVYSHVTETPAEASVNLREEHVTVDRRPVDRPVDANTINSIRDGVLEVTETSEIPVVAKEARVVEEVVVGKEATQRTETVHDTVRRTDVNVEQIAGQTTTTGSTLNTTGTTLGSTAGHTARDLADNAAGAVERTEGSLPGIQTGGHAVDGSNTPDTRGITEKIADTVTGNRVDDKTGRPV